MSLEDLYSQIQEGKVKELAIVVKADVQGSVEAIRQSLEKLSTDDVKVRVDFLGSDVENWMMWKTSVPVTTVEHIREMYADLDAQGVTDILLYPKQTACFLLQYPSYLYSLWHIMFQKRGALTPTNQETLPSRLRLNNLQDKALLLA